MAEQITQEGSEEVNSQLWLNFFHPSCTGEDKQTTNKERRRSDLRATWRSPGLRPNVVKKEERPFRPKEGLGSRMSSSTVPRGIASE